MSSLKERVGVKRGLACRFAAVEGLQGMAAWPHGSPALVAAVSCEPGGVRVMAVPGKAAGAGKAMRL